MQIITATYNFFLNFYRQVLILFYELVRKWIRKIDKNICTFTFSEKYSLKPIIRVCSMGTRNRE